MLLVLLWAIVATRKRQNQRIIALQLAELARCARVIGQFVVGENASGHNIRTHDWTPLVSLQDLLLKYLLSKIQSDSRAWLGTAYEHVPGSGPLQRLRVISDRSVDQTRHASMTDSNPARPSDRNVARFRQFKQTGKLSIPGGGDPAARERDCGAGPGRPLRRVRSVNDLRHTRGNCLERTEDFRVHIPGKHTPVSQPVAQALQE